MILLLRLVVIVLFMYFVYVVYEWIMQMNRNNVICPNCDGEGKWQTVRELETCLLCKGSGVIESEDESA